METVSERLRYVMDELGIRQVDVSALTGVSAQSISHIVANNVKKSFYSYQIAIGLGVNPEWLSTGQGQIFTQMYALLPFYNSIDDLKNNIPNIKKKIAVENVKKIIHTFSLALDENNLIICGVAPKNEIKKTEYFCLFYNFYRISEKLVDNKDCILCCQILEWRRSNLKNSFITQEFL